jgi:dihydrofolate reductase
MGKLTVTAFTTLDNVAEDPHLWSGAFFSDETGEVNADVLREADSMLLGRVTYDGFAAAWPSRSGDLFSDKFNAMPKHVVSTTLERADWNNTSIISDDIVARIRALRDQENVLVWGSPTLVKTLMDEGLVDEFVLLVSPIARGAGKKLLPEDGAQRVLRITEPRLLEGGMLVLRMTPAGS